MVNQTGAKTLLEIIAIDWHRRGGKGQWPTKAFVAEWRKRRPAYDGHSLDTRFWSGSTVSVKPYFRLQRATDAWIAAGKGSPVLSDEFNEYLENFRDVYDELEGE